MQQPTLMVLVIVHYTSNWALIFLKHWPFSGTLLTSTGRISIQRWGTQFDWKVFLGFTLVFYNASSTKK